MAYILATGWEAGGVPNGVNVYSHAFDFYTLMGWTLSTGNGCWLSQETAYLHRDANGCGGNWCLFVEDGALSPLLDMTGVDGVPRWLHFYFKRWQSSPGTPFNIVTYRYGNAQFSVRFLNTGYIELRRGTALGTLVATSASPIDNSQGYWVAIELVAADSGGVCNVYLNGSGTPAVTFSGDTKQQTDADWDQFEFTAGNAWTYVDDVIVTDGTTGEVSEVYGVAYNPISDVNIQWTPAGGGTNWSKVAPPFSQSSYIKHAPTVTDYYGVRGTNWVDSCPFVVAQGVFQYVPNAGNYMQIGIGIYGGSGTFSPPNTETSSVTHVRTTQPAGGAWTEDGLNTMQLILRVSS